MHQKIGAEVRNVFLEDFFRLFEIPFAHTLQKFAMPALVVSVQFVFPRFSEILRCPQKADFQQGVKSLGKVFVAAVGTQLQMEIRVHRPMEVCVMGV